MAVSSELNGTAVVLTSKPQDVPVNFQFFVASDLVVTKTDGSTLVDTPLSISTHFQVSGGNNSTGTVRILDTSAVAVNDIITIVRSIPYTQTTELEEGGPLSAATLEQRLDRTVMQIQQLKAIIARCLRLGDTSGTPGVGDIKSLANKFLGFDTASQLTGYTATQMAGLIALSATVNAVAFWADDAARALEVPTYVPQLGVQLDTGNIYRSTGLSAGNWTQGALIPGNNLEDLDDPATARDNLGANDAGNLTEGIAPTARIAGPAYALNLILGQ
jgi:hypothetical protein